LSSITVSRLIAFSPAASMSCRSVSARISGTSPYNTSTSSSSATLGIACMTAWPVPSCSAWSAHFRFSFASAARTASPPWP
jgi:hypothetical protein